MQLGNIISPNDGGREKMKRWKSEKQQKVSI